MIIKCLFNTTETMLKDRGLNPFGRVQKAVDSEVLRRSDKYIPFLSGALKKSGINGTKIGSGEVVYNAVHAHKNYYENKGLGKQGTASGGLRGRFWFERMKADHLPDIIRTARGTVGRK